MLFDFEYLIVNILCWRFVVCVKAYMGIYKLTLGFDTVMQGRIASCGFFFKHSTWN